MHAICTDNVETWICFHEVVLSYVLDCGTGSTEGIRQEEACCLCLPSWYNSLIFFVFMVDVVEISEDASLWQVCEVVLWLCAVFWQLGWVSNGCRYFMCILLISVS